MRSNNLIYSCMVVLLSLPLYRAQAAPGKPVQLYIGELTGVGPNRPMQALAHAIKRDWKSRHFRVTWSDFSSMGSCRATALYDRKRGTLKTYSSGSNRVSDTPEKHESKQQSYLYRAVSDEIIIRLAKKNAKTTQYVSEEAFFPELTRFGCTKTRLTYKVSYMTP